MEVERDMSNQVEFEANNSALRRWVKEIEVGQD